MSTLLWVDIATPTKIHQDEQCAAGVEEEADSIEPERQVFGGLQPMQHLKRWWMVKKVPAENRNRVNGNSYVKTAFPLHARLCLKSIRNLRC